MPSCGITDLNVTGSGGLRATILKFESPDKKPDITIKVRTFKNITQLVS